MYSYIKIWNYLLWIVNDGICIICFFEVKGVDLSLGLEMLLYIFLIGGVLFLFLWVGIIGWGGDFFIMYKNYS